jgi:hypothetical protein
MTLDPSSLPLNHVLLQMRLVSPQLTRYPVSSTQLQYGLLTILRAERDVSSWLPVLIPQSSGHSALSRLSPHSDVLS